jgi:lactoylglutathione lyase
VRGRPDVKFIPTPILVRARWRFYRSRDDDRVAEQEACGVTLNHLNLTVPDPCETSAFLAKYFGLRPGGGNHGMQMLSDDSGMVLTLMKARADDRLASPDQEGQRRTTGPAVKYPSSFHIGFIQESRDRVNEINEQLRADGIAVAPPAHLHGAWTFYLTAPGGFTIEVMG